MTVGLSAWANAWFATASMAVEAMRAAAIERAADGGLGFSGRDGVADLIPDRGRVVQSDRGLRRIKGRASSESQKSQANSSQASLKDCVRAARPTMGAFIASVPRSIGPIAW